MSHAPAGTEYLAPLLALVTIAISVPLVLRKIPPNRLYGFRTCKTLSDPQIWYEANYRGGVIFILAALAALIFWTVLMLVLDPASAASFSVAGFLVAITIGIAVWFVQTRKL